MAFKVTRRDLLIAGVTGGAAFVVGAFVGTRRERWAKRTPQRPQPFAPNVFVAIDEEGLTTIWLTKSEMGQGVETALPQILASELGAQWSDVRVVHAVANRNYGNQGTMASTSVSGMWSELRQAGAAARVMLCEAAAQVWEVEASSCDTAQGAVVHTPSGRTLPFGALVVAAAEREVPSDPPLRADAGPLVGASLPRLDTLAKIRGEAVFGVDVRLAGMAFAALARPPVPGGTLRTMDERAARQVEGVTDVVRLGEKVAVLATSTWAAFQGRDALAAAFHAPSTVRATDDVAARLRGLLGDDADAQSAVGVDEGDALAALAAAARTVEATYEVPLLPHQTMEPPNATAHVTEAGCRIWAPTQAPQGILYAAQELLGMPAGEIEVNVTYLGGGFGRRGQHDEALEAIELSRATGRPVQVVWSREDDVRHDYYRPCAAIRMRAALEESGSPSALVARVASPSLGGNDSAQGEADPYAIDGITGSAYHWPALRVEWTLARVPVNIGIWRSVGHSYTAFATESFVDELALAAGRDPVSMRRAMLPERSRARDVMERVLTLCAWESGPPEGRARGLAVHACFGSVAAQVAEVSLEGETPRVHRVWCAVECGKVVNPGIVRAQVEGGINFGLSAALYGGLTMRAGAIVESNFHDHRILRLPDAPQIEVDIVQSERDPSGVGELAVPPIAAALANAMAALGLRRRRLPLAES